MKQDVPLYHYCNPKCKINECSCCYLTSTTLILSKPLERVHKLPSPLQQYFHAGSYDVKLKLLKLYAYILTTEVYIYTKQAMPLLLLLRLHEKTSCSINHEYLIHELVP